jgi:hypothetical protein
LGIADADIPRSASLAAKSISAIKDLAGKKDISTADIASIATGGVKDVVGGALGGALGETSKEVLSPFKGLFGKK